MPVKKPVAFGRYSEPLTMVLSGDLAENPDLKVTPAVIHF